MTRATIDGNGRLQRKTLSSQIDRLDSMLEGLSENLNDAVGLAVKETVAQVVRDAVEVVVKEVLSNPELLKAALAQHIPPQAPPAPPKPERPTFMERVKGSWNWLCRKVTQGLDCAKEKVSQGLCWCVEKVLKGCTSLWNHRKSWTATCVGTISALGAFGLTLWHLRRSVAIALAAGLLAGISGYVAGPVVCALLSSLAGMAISLSAMILWPLFNLLRTSKANNALD